VLGCLIPLFTRLRQSLSGRNKKLVQLAHNFAQVALKIAQVLWLWVASVMTNQCSVAVGTRGMRLAAQRTVLSMVGAFGCVNELHWTGKVQLAGVDMCFG
jgi:hypothetical protein